MSTPAPRRRPRVAAGFAGGLSGLVNSLIPSPQDQLAAAAKATADAKAAAAKRATNYSELAKDYQNGDATYSATETALKAALAAESDPDLQNTLRSYLRDTDNTKLVRDVNGKVDDFNNGRLSFAELQQNLDKVRGTTQNENILSGIQKALDGARKAENARQLTKLNDDYSNGRMDINAYVSAVNTLRADPSQKDPNELQKFDAAISAAKQNERSLNDMRVYAKWEAGTMSPDDALAYYSGRMATASDPKDLENLDKFSQNIRTIVAKETASGNASVGSTLKANAAEAHKQLDDYFKNVVEPGVTAAKGDPYLITELYKNLGALAKSFVPYVGSEAGFFAERAQSAVTQGLLVAANEVTKRIDGRVSELQQSIDDARKNKSLTNRGLLARIESLADEASKLEQGGEFGQWTTQEQKAHGTEMRLDAWRQANDLANELVSQKDKALSQATSSISAAFADAQRALKSPNSSAGLVKALTDAGAFDPRTGKLDKNAFSEWITSNPEENAQLVFDSANTRKVSTTGGYDSEYDKGRTDYVKAITDALDSSSQLVKDAREALTQAQYIQSPSLQGVTVPSIDKTRADAMSGLGEIHRPAALPLFDSRTVATGEGSTAPGNNMLDPGNVDNSFPSQDPSEAQREQNRAAAPQSSTPASPTLRPYTDTASFLSNLGSGIRDLFGQLNSDWRPYTPPAAPVPAPAGPPQTPTTWAQTQFTPITDVSYSVPTFQGFDVKAPDLIPDLNSDAAGKVNPFRWDIPKPTTSLGGGDSGSLGDSIGGPNLTA